MACLNLSTFHRDLIAARGFLRLYLHVKKVFSSNKTFVDLFRHTLSIVGNNKIAIICKTNEWTFGDVDVYSNKVANYLLECGFKKGDVIALFLDSCPAFVGVWLGAAKIGVVVVFVNTHLRNYTLIQSLMSVPVCGIIVGSKLKHAIDDISSEFSCKHIWTIDEQSNPKMNNVQSTSLCNWNEKISLVSKLSPPRLLKNENSHNHLVYIFTSGTTGLPKAAIISTIRFVTMASGIRKMYNLKCSDVVYIPLPLYHAMGGGIGVGQMLLFGSTIVIEPKFSAFNYWTNCMQYKCTVAFYIGEICRFLLAQPPRNTDTQHKVRLMFGNGLRLQIWTEFQKRFKIEQIAEVYGATESIANIGNVDNTPGSLGFIPNIGRSIIPVSIIKIDLITQLPIRNPQTKLCQRCFPNEVGEFIGRIVTSNPMRKFEGYTNKEASEKKILRDVFTKGDMWFASGDLMYFDELGNVYFVDRLGDTFRWRGENVSTAEVEQILDKVINYDMFGSVYGVKIEGMEGRAGMAAIGLGQEALDNDAENKLIRKLDEAFKKHLPLYARPLFIRLCPKLEMTCE